MDSAQHSSLEVNSLRGSNMENIHPDSTNPNSPAPLDSDGPNVAVIAIHGVGQHLLGFPPTRCPHCCCPSAETEAAQYFPPSPLLPIPASSPLPSKSRYVPCSRLLTAQPAPMIATSPRVCHVFGASLTSAVDISPKPEKTPTSFPTDTIQNETQARRA